MALFSKEQAQEVQQLTLDDAMRILAAARSRAESKGLRENIAVVDSGNNLIAFVRMDGAWLGSIQLAQDKAFTARAFDMSTRELGAMSQPKQPLYGIDSCLQGRVVTFSGGIPLKKGTMVYGAIGVSGATPDQDHDVAQAGADAFK